MHPFIRGESYDREQILDFIGSKQHQSGIVHGHESPDFIAIFTGGRHGKRSGYEDGWAPDGLFRYCGQGTRGNQLLISSNKLLSEHQGIVLLFETWKPKNSWKGKQRFLGEYKVIGHEWKTGQGIRQADQLIIFSLVPIENFFGDYQLHISSKEGIDLASLRADAINASQTIVFPHPTRSEYRARSARVARYVLARSNGICESCNKKAPFSRNDGSPYLEVHHTSRLADEGPDDILHVAGICPNCHREAHFGPEVTLFRDKLEKLIAEKERDNYQSTRSGH